MKYAIWYLTYALLSLFILWVFYLAVMKLAEVKKRQGLNFESTALGYVVLFIGYALDCNANVGVMTVLLLEVPHETTVTARLKRHNESIQDGRWLTRWRKWLATRFEPILDPYDPTGNHI